MAPKQKQPAEDEQVYEQEEDAFGRVRLDRPHTGEEAAAQDADHRATHENRTERFVRNRRL